MFYASLLVCIRLTVVKFIVVSLTVKLSIGLVLTGIVRSATLRRIDRFSLISQSNSLLILSYV